MPTPALEFERVTFGADDVFTSSVSEITFALESGDLLLVLLERERPHLPLADLAVGILAPYEGRVTIKGSDWLSMDPGVAAENRGRIGRVFEGNPWINNLDVSQNIMLGQQHHTRRPIVEIARQAETLSRTFGLPGLPLDRPSTLRGKDRVRAACVRAFLGEPDVLILERPTAGVFPALLPALLNALRAARDRGAAVIWLTDNIEVWSHPGVRATLRGQMYGARMRVGEEENRP